MVDDRSESGVLTTATMIRAVVEFLLMNGRVEMLVESIQRRESTVTEITLVSVDVVVVCSVGGGVDRRCMPL